MTNQPLDEQYFVWLYSQVADPEIVDPSLSYWELLKQFFGTEFVWLIHKDENRLQDGKALRYEFIRSADPQGVDPDWMNLGCSVLELMIGLSRHLAFMAGGEPPYWFWQITENIGLRQYTDEVYMSDEGVTEDVADILERVIQRRYRHDGGHGFFPLKQPNKDQRGVELWYQMGAYVLEIDE